MTCQAILISGAVALEKQNLTRVHSPLLNLSVALWLCGSVALWLCGSVVLGFER